MEQELIRLNGKPAERKAIREPDKDDLAGIEIMVEAVIKMVVEELHEVTVEQKERERERVVVERTKN